MARVCASSPVEHPAERMRSARSPVRVLRSFSAFSMGSEKTWSWGDSRKKYVSLFVRWEIIRSSSSARWGPKRR
jgi:hypothetical protein